MSYLTICQTSVLHLIFFIQFSFYIYIQIQIQMLFFRLVATACRFAFGHIEKLKTIIINMNINKQPTKQKKNIFLAHTDFFELFFVKI